MARELKEYRIFFASPGGLQKERKAFRAVIDEYNGSESGHRGVHFVAVGWDDTLPGVGRPQAKINEDVQTCNYFLLMLWNWWGTPPDRAKDSTYTSGTEEEYYLPRPSYDNPPHSLVKIPLSFTAVNPA